MLGGGKSNIASNNFADFKKWTTSEYHSGSLIPFLETFSTKFCGTFWRLAG